MGFFDFIEDVVGTVVREAEMIGSQVADIVETGVSELSDAALENTEKVVMAACEYGEKKTMEVIDTAEAASNGDINAIGTIVGTLGKTVANKVVPGSGYVIGGLEMVGKKLNGG